ncbi:MAG: hypothetical protein ACT4OV_12120 [Microthrixaceae bacterium]
MAATCSRCGELGDAGDDLPLGWSMATTRRGIEGLCPTCTRSHVRDIEAKLDDEWWV